MQERILSNKKNGMAVLLLTLLAYVVAIAGIIVFANFPHPLMIPVFVLCIVWCALGWIFWGKSKVWKREMRQMGEKQIWGEVGKIYNFTLNK